MPLISQRIVKLDTSALEQPLSRIAYLLERLCVAQGIPIEDLPVDMEELDADDYSAVVYSNEDAELVQQHLNKRIIGVPVNS